MRAAITAVGKRRGAHVDPRFGRCNYLAIADAANEHWDFVPNPGLTSGTDAGVRVARELIGRQVTGVLTGQIGSDALTILRAAGIEVRTGVTGTVQEAFNAYRHRRLVAAAVAGLKSRKKV